MLKVWDSAAPQMGLPIQVVTINLAVLFDDLPEYKDFLCKAYINAHILEVSGEEVSAADELLSLPGIHESVKRGNKYACNTWTRTWNRTMRLSKVT